MTRVTPLTWRLTRACRRHGVVTRRGRSFTTRRSARRTGVVDAGRRSRLPFEGKRPRCSSTGCASAPRHGGPSPGEGDGTGGRRERHRRRHRHDVPREAPVQVPERAQGLLFTEDLPDLDEQVGYRGPDRVPRRRASPTASSTTGPGPGWSSPASARPTGSGTQRLYSFRDILVLKVVKRLLDTGVSLQQIRIASATCATAASRTSPRSPS